MNDATAHIADNGKSARVTLHRDNVQVTWALTAERGHTYTVNDMVESIKACSVFADTFPVDASARWTVRSYFLRRVRIIMAKEVGPPGWRLPKVQIFWTGVRFGWRMTAYTITVTRHAD